MADLYYFPLMAGDWLAGEATSLMTAAQEGAFIRLLCRQWMSSDVPCSLPNDDTKLAQLSRLGDEWSTIGMFVRAQFEEIRGDPTRIRNPKLWALWREAQQQHQKRVVAGKRGGETKAANRRRPQVAKGQGDRPPSSAKAGLEQFSSNAVALPSNQNQNQNHNQITTTTGYPPNFEMLRKDYPKRAGGDSEADAWKQYQARLGSGETHEVIHAGTLRYAAYIRATGKEKTEYVKQMCTFLGKSRHYLEPWDVPSGQNGKLGSETPAEYQFRKRGYIS